jgi:hypothetical protein
MVADPSIESIGACPLLRKDAAMSTSPATRDLNIRELCLGLSLLAIAAGGLLINWDYEAGSASRMGPGYMPMLVFGLIALFAVGILVTAFRSGRDPFFSAR